MHSNSNRAVGVFVVMTTLLAQSATHGDSTINSTEKYAWSANAGWINFEANITHGIVTTESYLADYTWAANIGWIHLGNGAPDNGYHYANNSATDFGVNHDGAGNLHGYAWSANTGWINFGPAGSTHSSRPRINLLTGAFSGYAWSANLGWIHLGSGYLMTDNLNSPDTDNDQIGDSWEMYHFGSLSTISDISDYDNDGQSDLEEYSADTDPTDPESHFEIVSYNFGVSIGKVSLKFTSSPTRLYHIHYTDDLTTILPWTDSAHGLFTPSTGATTNKTFSIPVADLSFFTVESIKPLQL